MLKFNLQKLVNRSTLAYFKLTKKNLYNFRAEFSMLLAIHSSVYLPIPFLMLWLFRCLWPLLIAYSIFVYIDARPGKVGRPIEILKRWSLWRGVADYFPLTLIREAELDPKRKYIFGYHPHGTSGLGAFFNFCTYGTDSDLLFPGLKFRIMVIKQLLLIPLFREFALGLGVCPIGKRTIDNVLNKGPGHACVIVVGGVKELLAMDRKTLKIVLSTRKGFIRQAIKNGADLVPVFGFNEEKSYIKLDHSEGTLIHKINSFTKKFTSFPFILIYGRGFYSRFGFMPFRIPLVTVVGAPITVEQDPNPTEEMVDEYHQRYIAALTDLYNRNKDKYCISGNPPQLEII